MFFSCQERVSFPIPQNFTNVLMVNIKNIDNKNTDQADTVNPFDRDVSLRPGNLYANLVLAESEQVSYYNQYFFMRMNYSK